MHNKHQHYTASINRVLDYIDENLAHSFSLEELARQANFSKFHFHRIFSALLGESPFQYILRLRLEKAASRMLMQANEPLTNIAYQYGFLDLSVFSRNFKKYFNTSPSVYREQQLKKSNLSQTNRNIAPIDHKLAPYFCATSKTIKWQTNMDIIKQVEVRELAKTTVAYNRSVGPYKGNDALYQKHRGELFAWAASKNLLAHQNFKYLILYHDNPDVALNDNQRMSLCVSIPENTETEGIIGKMEIQAGKYLVCSCELSATDFPKVWDWIYGQWLPASNYVPDDKPYFESYTEQPKGTMFKVDFCVPLKSA